MSDVPSIATFDETAVVYGKGNMCYRSRQFIYDFRYYVFTTFCVLPSG